MKEYFKFFKDKSVIASLLILLSIEVFMQFGGYTSFLKKNSYASNVNRISDHVIFKTNELDPDILILGSSLAYQGLSVPILNQKLEHLGLKVQSLALPGGDLIVQGLLLEKALKHFTKLKYIIHVNEAEMPWIDQRIPSEPTLAMASELNRKLALERLLEDDYKLSYSEFAFVLFKLIAYRRDLGDALLNPGKRIKDFGRFRKNLNTNPYEYENIYEESLALYDFKTIDDCLQVSSPFSPIPVGSNALHKDGLSKTCSLAKTFELPLDKNELTDLYAKRLKNFYNNIESNHIKIINVYPPFPHYLDFVNYPARINFWQKEFQPIIGKNKVINLLNIIPRESNSEYFYDLIHLNRKGMALFSDRLGDSLIEYFKSEN